MEDEQRNQEAVQRYYKTLDGVWVSAEDVAANPDIDKDTLDGPLNIRYLGVANLKLFQNVPEKIREEDYDFVDEDADYDIIWLDSDHHWGLTILLQLMVGTPIPVIHFSRAT